MPALYSYALWLLFHPALVGAGVLGVGLVFLSSNVHGIPHWLGDVLLLLASLALYIHTLAPTILPADSGEFQFVSYVLGIAHPPGYPLYTLLAKLATFLPLGDIAYRVNLFSALTSALTLVVLSRAVRRVTGSAMAGWMATAALGVSPTFWSQSTTANIRSLTALFTALQLGALIAYAHSKEHKYLLAFAVAFGLGITHHGSTALLILPYAGFLFVSDRELLRQPRALLEPLLAFLLSLLILLYLPLRSITGAPFDPQPIRSLSRFLEHVLALGFRGDMFYFLQPTVLPARLAVLWNILTLEFGPLLLLFSAWGAIHMSVRRSWLLLLCGGVLAVNALTAIAYRAPQTVEYMMPAHVVLAFLCGYGAWSLSKIVRAARLPGRDGLSALALSAALTVPLWIGWRNYPSFLQLSRDRSVRQYAEGVLTQAPQNACILSNWHYATPLWYLQYVEKMRADVEVVYVYPEGATPNAQVWLRRIGESVAQRPTIVTNFFEEFRSIAYQFRPFAGAWLVQSGPVYELAQGVQPLSALFDGRIHLVGFDTLAVSGDQPSSWLRPELPVASSDGRIHLFDTANRNFSPAGSLTVRLYWQPAVKLERDYSFFVHLVDESGAVLGQGDITHAAARYEVGEIILDEYHIPLLSTAKPGRYRLIAGVYITLPQGGWHRLTTEDGRDAVPLDEVEVQPLRAAPLTLHALYYPFACGYTLLGADYDHSLAGQLRLYLHWRCDRAGTEQDIVLYSRGTMLLVSRLSRAEAGTYLSTAHDLPQGAADLALELHSVPDEKPSALLGLCRLLSGHRVRLPTASAQDRYICLGGEMLLVRAEYPASSQAGALLRTRMTFVAMKPITNDYTVSLSLSGEGKRWQTQHDGTPALGAIPTLKWIRGVTIVDEHDLLMPSDASGAGILRLTVYDAFTMRPLPVLDERLARLGQGTQMELGVIAVR